MLKKKHHDYSRYPTGGEDQHKSKNEIKIIQQQPVNSLAKVSASL